MFSPLRRAGASPRPSRSRCRAPERRLFDGLQVSERTHHAAQQLPFWRLFGEAQEFCFEKHVLPQVTPKATPACNRRCQRIPNLQFRQSKADIQLQRMSHAEGPGPKSFSVSTGLRMADYKHPVLSKQKWQANQSARNSVLNLRSQELRREAASERPDRPQAGDGQSGALREKPAVIGRFRARPEPERLFA